ncbi:MAG: hypothetical protein H0V01_05600 [Bacteroidetes bacterium]|nr:hypothetical protein [Bacteroidota bacterium]HET6244379.1 DUF5683 domain-containing protein [Bacteroidia bacterium]
MLFLVTGIALFFLSPPDVSAQDVTADTLINQKKSADTLAVHSPKRAALMSAVLPGFGQIYNKKYWKLPIIYGGLIGLGYGVNSTQQLYKEYRMEYINRVLDKPPVNALNNNYSLQDLAIIRDDYRKTRDMLIIGTVGLYLLQIIDATVDAHLFTFDVSDDLSFDLRPDVYTCFNTQRSYAALTLRIKL